MKKTLPNTKKPSFKNFLTLKLAVYHAVFLLVALNFQYLKLDFQENHSKFPVFIGGVDEMTNFLKTISQLVF